MRARPACCRSRPSAPEQLVECRELHESPRVARNVSTRENRVFFPDRGASIPSAERWRIIPAVDGYIGLGSNLGEPVAELRGAVSELESDAGVEIGARSSLLPNGAGRRPQPGVVRQCRSPPIRLRGHARRSFSKSVSASKRPAAESAAKRNEPRILDLDILLLDDLVIVSEVPDGAAPEAPRAPLRARADGGDRSPIPSIRVSAKRWARFSTSAPTRAESFVSRTPSPNDVPLYRRRGSAQAPARRSSSQRLAAKLDGSALLEEEKTNPFLQDCLDG